jgi:hypothetical protein
MKAKLLGAAGLLAIVFGSVPAFAATVEVGSTIIQHPTYFNGFEGYNGNAVTSHRARAAPTQQLTLKGE